MYLAVETSLPVKKKSHTAQRRLRFESRDQGDQGWTGVFETEYMEYTGANTVEGFENACLLKFPLSMPVWNTSLCLKYYHVTVFKNIWNVGIY